MNKPSGAGGRLRTFVYAFRGLVAMLRTEPNARIHAVAAIAATAAGFLLGIDRFEWLIVILTIAAVISLEAVNTAIESICDLVSPELHPQVERAKDVAAGAVLVAAIAAVAVALLVFGPKVLALLAN